MMDGRTLLDFLFLYLIPYLLNSFLSPDHAEEMSDMWLYALCLLIG